MFTAALTSFDEKLKGDKQIRKDILILLIHPLGATEIDLLFIP